jgi:hypothetical protein
MQRAECRQVVLWGQGRYRAAGVRLQRVSGLFVS